MKRIGLLSAGTPSTAAGYADRIEAEIRHRFGHECSCRMAVLALHEPEIDDASEEQDARRLLEAVRGGVEALVRIGVEAIVPCSNRLQSITDILSPPIPVIAMYDAVGAALSRLSLRRIGLVGARSEKEEKEWRKELAQHQVLDMFVPVSRDREHLAHLVREELHQGIVNQTARADLGRIVYSLRRAGARAIVVTSPALGLALSHLDPVLPVLDATELHALAALEWSLNHSPDTQLSSSPQFIREKRPKNRAITPA